MNDASFDRVVESYRAHVNSGLTKLLSLSGRKIEVSASGNYVRDQDGKEYLDCGGFGVHLLGHRHPRVLDAVRRQLEVQPLPNRVFMSEVVATSAAKLASVAPKGMQYVYFATSGSEATDCALKLARTHGKRQIVAMEDAFHGKTIGAVSVDGNDAYVRPFLPLLPDVHRVPFGDSAAVEAVLKRMDGDAVVILEPIQGEAGVIFPPVGFLSETAELCRRYGALLIADEILTGLGRTGVWWAVEREEILPDILLAGKALSGGVVPVSAMIASETIFEPFNRDPFLHSTTFSNSQLGAGAAMAAVETIAAEDVPGRAHRVGALLLAEIHGILEDEVPSLLAEVRGVGLLIAVEFQEPYLAGEFFIELLERNVATNLNFGTRRACRFTPSAFLEDRDVDRLLAAVSGAARALRATHAA